MLVFPHCKINLGLHVTGRRPDGFHNIETVFYPVPVCDALEMISAAEDRFVCSGLPVPGDAAANLCVRAYALLKRDYPDLPPVHIHLHKIIPMGAGLGGGSSDGAFSIRLLNEKFGLQLDQEQQNEYAAKLGSDCAFFMQDQPCYARGKGDLLEPLPLDLSAYSLLLVYPDIAVPTAWAYSKITPTTVPVSLKEIIMQAPAEWKGLLKNDFEEPVFAAYPLIRSIKEQLYEKGAVYAAMSGSGSAVVGILPKNKLSTARDAWPSGCRVFAIP